MNPMVNREYGNLFRGDLFVPEGNIRYRDASPGAEMRAPGTLSNDFAHADDDLGVRAYPYMHSTGGSTDNRFLIRGGWSSQGLNAPTRVDYGAEELENAYDTLANMQTDNIEQDIMIDKARHYLAHLDAKVRADKALLKHNKNIYRHFKAAVIQNQRVLGMAIDSTDPISQSYMKGNGFIGQADRFKATADQELETAMNDLTADDTADATAEAR
ncbi:hypothetical protein AAMO2058_001430400 [Amorphochlora amoebiformis]